MPKSDQSSAAGGQSSAETRSHAFFAASSRWWRSNDDEGNGWRSNLVAFLILVVISFVMLWLADKLSSQGMVLTRYMATTQAPVTGRFYPEVSRDQITVLMYDDAYLRENGSAWPIPYQDHAEWLIRLAENPEAKPKAIFLDITFVQAREEASIAPLQSALCKLKNEYGVPVFLAALVSPEDGQLHVRPDLEATRDANGESCFTLVSVEHWEDPVDRQTWAYPLTTHIIDDGRVLGPAPDPSMPSYRSAAMVLAQDVAHIDLGKEEEPLALVWGATTSVQEDKPAFFSTCREGPRGATPSIPRVVRQLWDNKPKQAICPFHHGLSMVQVGQMDEAELAPFVAGRYLMVGAAVSGQDDFAQSPVHGVLPGVYVHAMALDNLLTYKDQYKQHSVWRLLPSWPMFLAGLIAIAVVFLVHVVFRSIRARLRANCWLKRNLPWIVMTAKDRDEANLRTRLFSVPIRLTVWLLRLSLQAFSVVCLIALMQWKFRIGMLPVVELVGMTILAEGLNYMDKVRVFLFGKPSATPKPAVAPDPKCEFGDALKPPISPPSS